MTAESFSGKSVLISGASSGIGSHLCALFAARGAAVTALARRESLLEDLQQDLADQPGSVQVMRADITDHAQLSACLGNVARPFDIVINNAGIGTSGRFLDMPIEDFDAVMATNLRGAFIVSQLTAQAMVRADAPGVILNVASILGHRVAKGLSAYAASKSALIQLTRSMALELARHRIRVNALCPGYIETDINAGFFQTDAGQAQIARVPQRRLGQLTDLDGPVLLLCSSEGGFMTGSTVEVDGGHLVSPL